MMSSPTRRLIRPSTWLLALLASTVTLPLNGTAEEPALEVHIDFNQQVRPIFTRHCSACHGGVKQAGDLSFVYPEQVLPPEGWVIEPGDPDASILIERVTSDDPDLRMPPPSEHADPLPAEEIETLRRWIEQGAKWGDHWSLAPLLDPVPQPATQRDGWPRQSLDTLVEAGQIRAGLTPSAEAKPQEWLRRVTFDLTGLPPTYEDTAEFVSRCAGAADEAQLEQVYRRRVDELLASAAYGERWASVWMDLARYADSKGFEKDPHRDMWPYRDWLIRAFNDDMPYDEFTIKQLAGDLLDVPTADDWIATAFHRNTQTNTEGGTDDEEFRVAAVIDRINTTWTVWQGITIGCVQCHSHPYDPLRHGEYYSVMALFNDSRDCDLDSDYPTFSIPLDLSQVPPAVEQQRQYEEVRVARNDMGRSLAAQMSWQPLTPHSAESTGGTLQIAGTHVRRAAGTFPVGVRYTIETAGVAMTALRIDILPESDDPAKWPEQGSVLSRVELTFVAEDGGETPLELADVFVDALAGPDDPRAILGKGNSTAIGGYPKLHRPRWAVLVLKERFQPPGAGRLRLQMEQSSSVTGNVATPLRNFQWSASDDQQWTELLESESLRAQSELLAAAKFQVDAIDGAALPIVLPRPGQVGRSTRLFLRGNWTDRGDEVSPGIPAVFANLALEDAPSEITNRLRFAQWLVSPENPLAARVWANRIWSQLFGIGIVETVEDFGSSGLLPANAELLDHLAISLRDRHDWRLKPFLRELVLSSTYRQSNRVDPSRQPGDPANRLLARGPRTRLSAEMVRDQALTVSKLLVETLGGASVMPPQPEGVWQTVYSGAEWKTSEGQNRYRRALYTYWRRTSPYPSLLTFDAPTRDLCAARRIATNTPLQALITMNDPVYVECSQSLGRLALQARHGDPTGQVDWMYRAVTNRDPSENELRALMELLADLTPDASRGGNDPAAGIETQAGDSTSAEPADLHALALVANTILNLDWALTK